ncbi:Gamma-tubulin complex component 2 [Halotydeus destructor]|nr:Gamma-tubulin complex component 2 [Halotydeus destructor]
MAANVTGDSKKSSRIGSSSRTADHDKKPKGRHRSFYKTEWKFLSFDYSTINWDSEEKPIPISDMSITAQENALIEDLLHVLVGVEGLYIRIHPNPEGGKRNVMLVDDEADKLLKTMAKKITALCPLYSNVIFFIDEKDHGLVNQALAAAMRGVIKDYFTLIAQLEAQYRRNDLTIQKMWYYLQPFFTNMEILKYFSSKIHTTNSSGGAVLSILHQKTISYTGNLKALDFCMHITRDACEPYFNILERWITEGVIYDPHSEFFVEDCHHSSRLETKVDRSDDLYWGERYKIVGSRLPVFFFKFQEKILNTGKYLSVILDCGKELSSPKIESFVYRTEERFYAEKIDIAYMSASKQLLQFLLGEADLVGHLISVKHYFFMDQGDFIVQFMDMADEELSKDFHDVNFTRLNSLLELSLRTSIMNSDTHKDEVSVELLSDGLLSQLSSILSMGSESTEDISFGEERSLKGFESIALNYKVEWPLTLILSRRNIACYQMLFRHLFCCKYVERQLGAVWKQNKVAKIYALSKVSAAYAEAFALRQRMLNFVQNLSYYMMVEVIEPSFHNFIAKINTMNTVDEIMKEHTNFVEGCLKDCMMTNKLVLHHMVNLLQICMSFSDFMQDNIKEEFTYERSKDVRLEKIVEVDENGIQDLPTFEQNVSETVELFNTTLLKLLEEIINQQQDHFSGNILPILYRLDFNEYYNRMFKELDKNASPDSTEKSEY